jgi:hypothetical protein
MSYFGSTDFKLEVGKGNVQGHTLETVVCRNPSANTVFEDVSAVGGTIVYPTAGETWELVSSSANDAAAGTGARTVRVRYLDVNYVEQFEDVTLNGTTPVTLVATNAYRIYGYGVFATTWGTTLANEGDITLRVAGAGATRATIPATENRSLDCYLTIPAGKSGIVVYAHADVAKNDDSVARFRLTNGANTGFFTGLPLSLVQNNTEFNLPAGSNLFDEKTDIKLVIKSSNNSEFNAIYQLMVIDNDLVNQA